MYAERVIFWVLEHMLKGSFFGSLSLHSKGQYDFTLVKNLHEEVINCEGKRINLQNYFTNHFAIKRHNFLMYSFRFTISNILMKILEKCALHIDPLNVHSRTQKINLLSVCSITV